jgi:glycosyltransferase involved in cell wall biosynthesis
MKILWVTTTPRKKIREILGLPEGNESSGTWIDAAYADLQNDQNSKDIHIDFAAGSRDVKKGKIVKGTKDGVNAYLTNLGKISFGVSGGKKTIKAWKQILNDEKPDVIHIWGCESSVAYDLTLANTSRIPVIVYIQGIIGINSLYNAGYIENEKHHPHNIWWEKERVLKNLKQRFYKKQIGLENKVIENAFAIVTDNQFTADYYKQIKQDIVIEKSPLPIGQAFFTRDWQYKKCIPNTIFTIFGADPNKGLHQLLKAITIVKTNIPNIKVFVPGNYELIKGHKAKKRNMSLFEIWARSFIRANKLEDNVVFLGKLSSNEMADQLQSCNVFVNPSCMEVHGGSVREAMIVGTPVVSSVCGDLLEIIRNGENGFLYRYEEYQILAAKITALLQNPTLASDMSGNEKKTIRDFMKKTNEEKSFASLYRKANCLK